jgi:serine/threonine-protein kinase HipA
MVETLCESAVTVGKELIEAARNEPAWRDVAKHMAHAWNDGMASLRSPKVAVEFRGLNDAIAAAGFFPADPPEKSRESVELAQACNSARR